MESANSEHNYTAPHSLGLMGCTTWNNQLGSKLRLSVLLLLSVERSLLVAVVGPVDPGAITSFAGLSRANNNQHSPAAPIRPPACLPILPILPISPISPISPILPVRLSVCLSVMQSRLKSTLAKSAFACEPSSQTAGAIRSAVWGTTNWFSWAD